MNGRRICGVVVDDLHFDTLKRPLLVAISTYDTRSSWNAYCTLLHTHYAIVTSNQ
jgi:hypothetical protein